MPMSKPRIPKRSKSEKCVTLIAEEFEDVPFEFESLLDDWHEGDESSAQRLLQYLSAEYSPGKSTIYG